MSRARAEPLRVGLEPAAGYRLRQMLGRGGFGEVWEAEFAGGPNVALKFMPADDNLAAAREIRAILAIKKLQHPNLVRIDQVWSQPGFIVISMELAEGSLLDLLEANLAEFKSPPPAEQICFLLYQAAEALDFLNGRQHLVDGQRVAIQHCDVKPSNLLLFGETVKLTDFGLASQTSARLRSHRREGTLDYAAPEIFERQLSGQSDQYSLAITYCVLRGGRLPFPVIQSFRGSWPRRRPKPDLTMLSEPEQPIITRALSRVPLDRWSSCRELMIQLSRAVSGLGEAARARQPYVLVVDDEPIVRQMLQLALEYAGFPVLLAGSGTEAVEVYQNHRSTIGLVLLDVHMPEPDGLQTLALLQEINPAVRCCFMTADSAGYSEAELLQRGARRLFHKPLDLGEVARYFQSLLASNKP